VAYQVSRQDAEAVFESLDARESGGYQRLSVDFIPKARSRPKLQAMAYFADQHNPNYLGEASLPEIAGQVLQCSGRSGHNVEYVLRLAEALDELDSPDSHVFELANLLSDPAADD
jgi:cation transport protein ChaC